VQISQVIESAVSGFQFRDGIEPSADGNVAVLQVKDIRDGSDIRRENLARVRIEKDIEPYTLKSGYVLFLSRGHRPIATALVDPPPNTIVPNYFYIIRPKPTVLPGYLAWVINSAQAQAQLQLVNKGSHMPMVSKTDFLQLEIDVPPLDVQKTIVALDELSRREQQLSDELLATKRKLIEHLCVRAASGQTGKDHQNG